MLPEIVVVNNTSTRIQVRITGEGESSPGLAFYPIDAHQEETWKRQYTQVGFAYREDSGKTEVQVVLPGHKWQIF